MHNLIFFGSDRYSAVVLASLLEPASPAGGSNIYQLVSVVTDQQSGGSPVEQLARTHNLPVTYYPTTPEEKSTFVSLLASWFVDKLPTGLCASFDHLIPQDIIKLFGGHLYNLHPSLLPQYRNVSPVQYAIALGDTVTGITLFRISPGIDDGEIITQTEEPILLDDTTATLTPRLFAKGAKLFLEHLSSPGVKPISHSRSVISVDLPLVFTKRLKRNSGYIEWPVLHKLLRSQPVSLGESKNELLNLRLQKESMTDSHQASSIYLLDLMRALNPWPTVWSTVPTKKGELRITLESVTPEIRLKIAGKPKPITYSDFFKYYL